MKPIETLGVSYLNDLSHVVTVASVCHSCLIWLHMLQLSHVGALGMGGHNCHMITIVTFSSKLPPVARGAPFAT